MSKNITEIWFESIAYFHSNSIFLILFCFNLELQKLSAPSITRSTSSEIFLSWVGIDQGPKNKTYVISWRSTNSRKGSKDQIRRTSTKIGDLESNTDHAFCVRVVTSDGISEISDNTTGATGQ